MAVDAPHPATLRGTVTDTEKTRPAVRVRGRSFIALVLTPEAPLADWMAAVDEQIARARNFFVDRPVVLDLGLLEADAEAEALAGLPAQLAERGIRLVAAENVPDGTPGFPAALFGGRATGEEDLPPPPEPPRPIPSLLIEEPVRSGTQIVFAAGDVTVIGSIASGAEVMAGGSIHVYGAIRGRAVAGVSGNPAARILCRALDAELLAIDGYYLTADDMDATLRNRPAMARLDGERIAISALP